MNNQIYLNQNVTDIVHINIVYYYIKTWKKILYQVFTENVYSNLKSVEIYGIFEFYPNAKHCNSNKSKL